MFKGVIFDVDGTLVDSVDLHAAAWQNALRHLGHPLPYKKVRQQIGKGADQLLPALLPAAVVARRGKEIERFRGALFKRDYLPMVRGFSGVRALVQRLLVEGARIALASSARHDELAAYKRSAEIDDLVEAEAARGDAAHSKPDPDIFVAALERLKLAARDAIVVGDTPYDAEAARKAGMAAIGVLCGGFPESELRAAGCVEVFHGPADLLHCLDESLIMRR
jgi:phosphoglycolate phosphatase-like HAD superfamily hydrolase